MTKRAIVSDQLSNPAGLYSHVVERNGVVYTAGFGPQDPATGEVPDGIAAQTEQVISNVETALAQVGLTLADVVKTTVFLQDMAEFAAMNEVYGRFFGAHRPARSTVGVGGLPRGVRVEIEVIAAR